MKRLLFLSGILLLLSGCGLWQKNSTLSYDNLRSHFVQDNFSSPLFSSIVVGTGEGFRERLQLQAQGEDDSMHLQFSLRGQKDSSVSGAIGSYLYDVDFLDKTENLPVHGSGDLLYISKDGKEYLRTNTTKVNLGTGSAEGVMVQLIVDALSKKWLYIDKPGFIQTQMFSLPMYTYLYTMPLGIKNIFAGNFLKPWSQESNGTYSIDGSYDMRNQFMPLTASSGFAFAGTLGTKNISPIFNLERFVFGDRKGIGTVAAGKGNLVLQSGDVHYTISWENASYGAVSLIVSYTVADVKQWDISATVRQKTIDDGSLLRAIKGTISVLCLSASPHHYVPIHFQGNYALNKQHIGDIRVPTNTLLISQFFGDEFGLGALLNQ